MTNGVISGTPTVNQTTAVTYTLYANNSGGSDSETTITINEPVANLGAIADQTFTVTQQSPTLSQATLAVQYNLGNSPNTPDRVEHDKWSNFWNTNCESNHSSNIHLYANNSGGSDSGTFTITINEPVGT